MVVESIGGMNETVIASKSWSNYRNWLKKRIKNGLDSLNRLRDRYVYERVCLCALDCVHEEWESVNVVNRYLICINYALLCFEILYDPLCCLLVIYVMSLLKSAIILLRFQNLIFFPYTLWTEFLFLNCIQIGFMNSFIIIYFWWCERQTLAMLHDFQYIYKKLKHIKKKKG